MPDRPMTTDQGRALVGVILAVASFLGIFYLVVLRPVWAEWDQQRAACEAQAGHVWVQSRTGQTACVAGRLMR